MDNEFYTDVWRLFHRMVNDVNDKMLYAIEFNREDFILQAPDFIIELLKTSMVVVSGNKSYWKQSEKLLFEGIKIESTHEMAIVLFHKDYPIYRQEWMLKKISLEQPFLIKEESFTKTILKIRELFPIAQSALSEN